MSSDAAGDFDVQAWLSRGHREGQRPPATISRPEEIACWTKLSANDGGEYLYGDATGNLWHGRQELTEARVALGLPSCCAAAAAGRRSAHAAHAHVMRALLWRCAPAYCTQHPCGLRLLTQRPLFPCQHKTARCVRAPGATRAPCLQRAAPSIRPQLWLPAALHAEGRRAGPRPRGAHPSGGHGAGQPPGGRRRRRRRRRRLARRQRDHVPQQLKQDTGNRDQRARRWVSSVCPFFVLKRSLAGVSGPGATGGALGSCKE